MAKNKLSTGCSDWQLRWSGMVGRLTLNPMTNTFIWKGQWNGRHGQTGPRRVVEFTFNNGEITAINGTDKGFLPVESEVLKAVNIILNSQLKK